MAASKSSKDPELVMLRHHDYRRAIEKHGKQKVEAHVRRSEHLISRVVRKFWGHHDRHPNRLVMGRAGQGETDLQNMGGVWAGGFLAYRPEVPSCEKECWRKSFAGKKEGGPCKDCRDLHRHLRQRLLEALDIARRQAPNCTPEPSGIQREDVEECSVSEGSRGVDPSTEGQRQVSNLRRIQLLERLAVHSDEEAVAILSAEELTDDIRSQGGRLLQEVGSCNGTGECSLCEIRRRPPDQSLLRPKFAGKFEDVRAFLEHFLSLESPRWRQLLKGKPAPLRKRLFEQHRHAAHVLGFLATNADASPSVTCRTFELLDTAAGSVEERAILGRCLAEAPTIRLARESTDTDRSTVVCIEEWEAYSISMTRSQMKSKKLKDTWREELARRAEEAKKTLDKDTQYPCLKVQQNGQVLYYLSIPIDDLFDYCTIDRHVSDTEKGYQRVLDEKRADEIAEYLAPEGASIPGTLTLSARPEAKLTYNRQTKCLSYERVPGAFAVLDGQHRLHGHHRCKTRHRVAVGVYENLDRATEARLFIDLNTLGKSIPPALVKGVKAIAGTESEPENFLRRLFSHLNTAEDSPLKGRLAVGGNEPGKLTRTVFDAAVGKAVKSELFAKVPIERQAELVLAYLKVVGATLADPAQLTRRDYFGAVVDAMDAALRISKKEKGSVKPEALREVVARFRAITEADYPGAGRRARLAEGMRNCMNPADISVDD